jgi:hypothetical protein
MEVGWRGQLDLLHQHVAKLVYGYHLPLLATCDREDDPDDHPEADSDQADNEVQKHVAFRLVVHRLTVDDDRHRIALGLDTSASGNGLLDLLSENCFSFL